MSITRASWSDARLTVVKIYHQEVLKNQRWWVLFNFSLSPEERQANSFRNNNDSSFFCMTNGTERCFDDYLLFFFWRICVVINRTSVDNDNNITIIQSHAILLHSVFCIRYTLNPLYNCINFAKNRPCSYRLAGVPAPPFCHNQHR